MRLGTTVRVAGAAAAVVGLAAIGLATMAQAQAPAPLRIGVMEGFSGVYGDLTLGGVEAAQMAVDDFGGKVLGRPIEIVSADHQTKPDVGAGIARRWYDVDGVKMITGLGTSSVALAVRKISQEKGMIDIVTGAARDLTKTLTEHDDVDALWVFGTKENATLAEKLSVGNLKRLLVDHGLLTDWFDGQAAEGPILLRHAVQVKNIWIPYGE